MDLPLYLTAIETSINSISEPIFDLEKDEEFLYALAVDKIYKISINDETVIETVNATGLSNPQGFALDGDGNIFIADTGNNRVVKFLKESAYAADISISPDGSFGVPGTGNGEFDSPRDVSLVGTGLEQRVYVLDAGNNRVQLFSSLGNYQSQFDGSTTPGGALNNPLNMVGETTLIITDIGNSTVRELFPGRDGAVSEFINIPFNFQFGKITETSIGLLIPDHTNNQFINFDINGELLRRIPIRESVIIGLPYNDKTKILSASASSGLVILENDRDPPGHTAIDKVKQFVDAFIRNDREEMLKLTDGEVRRVDKLIGLRDDILSQFHNITHYSDITDTGASFVEAHFTIATRSGARRFQLIRSRIDEHWIIRAIY